MTTKKLQVVTNIICIVSVGLSVITNTVFADDKCSDILAQGIRDEYNFSSSNSIEEVTHSAVCTKSYNSRSGSSEFAFNIPIPQLKSILGLGANDSYNSQKRKEFCDSVSSNISRSSSESFAKSVINKNIVDAWSSCINSKGLYCETENINDTHFRLKAYWEPSNRAEEPKIESDLVIVGGSCDNISVLKTGNYIRQLAPVTEACKRDSNNPNGQIFAFLNTTQGSLNCIIPKLVAPLDPSKYLQACVRGNYEGCTGLQVQAKIKRQACLDVVGPEPINMTPNEGQNRAVMMRSCGNIEANAQGTMALIENLWHDCNQYGTSSVQCNDAKSNLTMSLN